MKCILMFKNEMDYSVVNVSDSDYEFLSKYRWQLSRNGYARAMVNGVNMYMHRFIMNPLPTQLVDHIDGNRLNNERENLRCCTTTENNQNRIKTSRICTSKYKGVHYDKSINIWKCKVKNGYIGAYATEEEAALAYDIAALKEYGEFAKINNIDPATVVDHSKKKTSMYTGVSWFERDSTWKAQLVINHVNKHIGYYATEEEAAVAWNEQAKVHRPDLTLNAVSDTIEPVKVQRRPPNKYPGVKPSANGLKWTARCVINKEVTTLGTHETQELAWEAICRFKEGKE